MSKVAFNMFELGGRPVDPDIGNLGQDLSLKENFDSAIFLQWHLFGIVQVARIQQPCHSVWLHGGHGIGWPFFAGYVTKPVP